MIVRAMTLSGGLLSALAASQFPEYSQQYRQRLGGAVDELARQIERYEADAERAGLALPAMLTGLAAEGPLADTQADNIRADILRHERLSADLATLEGAGPFTRLRMVSRLGDNEIAHRAMQAYKPAMPVTFEGAVFAGAGFVAGWLAVSALIAFLAGGWSVMTGRRRRRGRI